jgi:transcriptional regulator with XRE-family HTH domain
VSAWLKKPLPHLQTLGRRIRSDREQIGRSQRWLADQIGVEPAVLRGIEKGRSSPQLITLLRIAAALNVSFDSLLSDLLSQIDDEQE